MSDAECPHRQSCKYLSMVFVQTILWLLHWFPLWTFCTSVRRRLSIMASFRNDGSLADMGAGSVAQCFESKDIITDKYWGARLSPKKPAISVPHSGYVRRSEGSDIIADFAIAGGSARIASLWLNVIKE